MTKYFLGCDPDIHNLSFFLIDEMNNVQGIWMVKEKSRYKGQKGRESARIMATAGMRRFIQALDDDILDSVCGIAVEGQNVTYTAQKGVNPQCIVDLSCVAGATISILSALMPNAKVYFPAPSEWKGTIPKHVKQFRVMRSLDMNYEKKGGKKPYPVPHREQWSSKSFGPDKINPGDWADVADSAGLALFAKDQFLKEK